MLSRVGTSLDDDVFGPLNAAIAQVPLEKREPCCLCSRPILKSGLCSLHIERRRRYGDPRTEPKTRPKTCQVEGCLRACAGVGLCDTHLHQYLRRNTPELQAIADRFRVYKRRTASK